MRTLGFVRAARPTETEIDAVTFPRLLRLLQDIDRVSTQGVVRGLSMRATKRTQPRHPQAGRNRNPNGWPHQISRFIMSDASMPQSSPGLSRPIYSYLRLSQRAVVMRGK